MAAAWPAVAPCRPNRLHVWCGGTTRRGRSPRVSGEGQTITVWEHLTGERCAGSEGDDRGGKGRGGEIKRERPRRPHSFYFDSASGVLLPYLFLNLSVLEFALTLPLRRLALCRCLDTWGKGQGTRRAKGLSRPYQSCDGKSHAIIRRFRPVSSIRYRRTTRPRRTDSECGRR
jgi:hypothetical protein